MSVTVISGTLNAANPKARLAIIANAADLYWDDTNKRWNSGIAKSVFTSLTWTGTKASGEVLKVTVQPANYQPMCNVRYVDTPLVTAASMSSGWEHLTAFNYGVPDPSAQVENDGSITLGYVDVELPPNSASSIQVTFVHTPDVLAAVDPYSDLGQTPDTIYVAVGSDANCASWGQINGNPSDTDSGYGAVQLKTLTTTFVGDGPAPTFVIGNVPQPYGNKIANVAIPLINATSRPFTFKDNYTWCFAINSGKIDANASPIAGGGGTMQFNMMNLGLMTDPSNPDALASATLSLETLVSY